MAKHNKLELLSLLNGLATSDSYLDSYIIDQFIADYDSANDIACQNVTISDIGIMSIFNLKKVILIEIIV